MKQKIADLINIIFGFRKFLLLILLYVIGIIFRVKDLINGAEMVDMFKSTTIAFMGANGVEHLMTTVKEYINAKGQVQAVQTVPTPVGDAVVQGDGEEDDSEASEAETPKKDG